MFSLTTTSVVIIVSPFSVIVLKWAQRNYHEYLDLGKSALPRNVFGWALATAVSLVARGGDTLSTDMYVKDGNPDLWLGTSDGTIKEGDLLEIPMRRGARPQTSWHVMPHRQVEDLPDENIKIELMQTMRNLNLSNTSLISATTSPHERLGDALVINPVLPTPHKTAEDAMREIAHVHSVKDHSLHVILSPLDCETVIKRGWGERHPLSGKVRALPKESLIIYAPRTPDEVLVAANIVQQR